MGTVTKALALLDLFTRRRPEIGLSGITRLSGLNKATAHRLLRELQALGYLEQVGAERAYRLGPQVLRLAALREATVPLMSVTRDLLERLAQATGETAHMSLVRGDRLSAMGHAYSPRHGTKVTMEDAEVLSFHATASGLAVLAFAEPGFTDAILAATLPAHTPDTVTDPEALRALLPAIRATGIAEGIGAFEADVHSHAAPVFGPDQRPIGALAVAAPVARMTPAQKRLIQEALRTCAREVTDRTGGVFPAGFPASAAA